PAKGGHLVTDRFASASGQQGQRVPSFQHRTDDLFLHGPEAAVSPVLLQNVYRCFVQWRSIFGLWTDHFFKSEVRSRKSEKVLIWAFSNGFSAFRLPISDFNSSSSKVQEY